MAAVTKRGSLGPVQYRYLTKYRLMLIELPRIKWFGAVPVQLSSLPTEAIDNQHEKKDRSNKNGENENHNRLLSIDYWLMKAPVRFPSNGPAPFLTYSGAYQSIINVATQTIIKLTTIQIDWRRPDGRRPRSGSLGRASGRRHQRHPATTTIKNKCLDIPSGNFLRINWKWGTGATGNKRQTIVSYLQRRPLRLPLAAASS